MIFVAGGTGFIGSNVVMALKDSGRETKCLVRSPSHAGRCASLGFTTVRGSITDRDSLKGALHGIDTVIHLVGIIEERKDQTFHKVHFQGTANLVEEAVVAGVKHFIYVSAIGADIESPFPYSKTKAQAEGEVKSSGIPHTIFRPSLVIGPGGGFVGKMLDLINSPGPFLPVPGSGNTKFQPIFVGDLAKCIVSSIANPNAMGKIFEIGGPEQLTYNQLLMILAELTNKEKKLLHIPMSLMMPVVKILEKIGISPVTSGQLGMLSVDNICDIDAVKKNFGFDPTPYRLALELSISQQAQGMKRTQRL